MASGWYRTGFFPLLLYLKQCIGFTFWELRCPESLTKAIRQLQTATFVCFWHPLQKLPNVFLPKTFSLLISTGFRCLCVPLWPPEAVWNQLKALHTALVIFPSLGGLPPLEHWLCWCCLKQNQNLTPRIYVFNFSLLGQSCSLGDKHFISAANSRRRAKCWWLDMATVS